MARDIRLDLGFIDHPKTVRLIRRMGWERLACLIRVWCYAAQHKPDGHLGPSIEDIEIAARYDGEPGTFVQGLLELGWLDQNETGYVLHDWDQHQGWIIHAPERKEQARIAAEARWRVKNGKKPKKAEPPKEAQPEPQAPPDKDLYGSHVRLTKEEFAKLVQKFGDTKAVDYIEALDTKIGANTTTYHKKYKSDYFTLLSWQRNGWLEPGRNVNVLGGTHELDSRAKDTRPIVYQTKEGWRKRLPDGTEIKCDPPPPRA